MELNFAKDKKFLLSFTSQHFCLFELKWLHCHASLKYILLEKLCVPATSYKLKVIKSCLELFESCKKN